MMIKVGEILKDLRIDRRMTQQEVADLMGLTRSAISNHECGRKEIKLETLCKYADLYNVTTDYLLGR